MYGTLVVDDYVLDGWTEVAAEKEKKGRGGSRRGGQGMKYCDHFSGSNIFVR